MNETVHAHGEPAVWRSAELQRFARNDRNRIGKSHQEGTDVHPSAFFSGQNGNIAEFVTPLPAGIDNTENIIQPCFAVICRLAFVEPAFNISLFALAVLLFNLIINP
ncbi:hypothetical protein SDC9_87916 [bioreactor metagenome]|uniref:Uncharacterized protein n=1 Tax=bioreactor metagenome TaxID=1076179 RepID=A0A644ZK57_9ZZZZ